MVNCFKGVTKVDSDKVLVACTNFKIFVAVAEAVIQQKVKEVEDEWEPSFLDKVFKNVTLKDKYNKTDRWMTYEGWLMVNHKLYEKFTTKQRDLIELHSSYKFKSKWFNVWAYNEEYNEVKALNGGCRDCYLTPEQAKFVDIYSQIDEVEI